MNLYTILIDFADRLVGIGQYSAVSPKEALMSFIKSNGSLEGYNREGVAEAFNELIHVANDKGIWLILFKPEILEIKVHADNPILGGTIVQTDPAAPVRNESDKP